MIELSVYRRDATDARVERRLDLRSRPNVGPALLVSASLVFPRGMAEAW
jgi:hypothetical protein